MLIRYRCLALALIALSYVWTPVKAAGRNSSPSLSLNTYNNYSFQNLNGWDEKEMIKVLARKDRVMVTEKWPSTVPSSIKALNPRVNTYRYYALCVKNMTDWDVSRGSSTGLLTPLSAAEIEANHWWLLDGNGRKVKENSHNFFLDVGKPGVKEAFLREILERLKGSGVDGVVFDYWCPTMISRWIAQQRLPMPARYDNDQEWFEKAWKPFVEYVMSGLHEAHYKVIGNQVGEYGSGRADLDWQRKWVDGVVYEQWAVDWPSRGGAWLSGKTIERRIHAFHDDPLEVWTADYGLETTLPDYVRRLNVSLAMYHIAIPLQQGSRSFGQQGNGKISWQPIWDFDIGDPVNEMIRVDGKYAWSREYTDGLVLLNYESDEKVTFKLDKKRYVDQDGKGYTDSVPLDSHTGLILREFNDVSTLDGR